MEAREIENTRKTRNTRKEIQKYFENEKKKLQGEVQNEEAEKQNSRKVWTCYLFKLEFRIWSPAYVELEANEGLFLARLLDAARRQAEDHNRNSIVSLVDKGLAFTGADV